MTESRTFTYAEQAKLSGPQLTAVAKGLNILSNAIAANNYEKGWREPNTPLAETRPVGDLVALLHSEVTEAFEAYRNNEPSLWYEHTDHHGNKSGPDEGISTRSFVWTSDLTADDVDPDEKILGKPQGIASELADVIIRVLDMAEEKRIPLFEAIYQKHNYNQTRPYRHGGKAV